jgi:hypothetical protein
MALHDIAKLDMALWLFWKHHINQVPAKYPLSIAGIFKVDTCQKKIQFCGVAQLAADLGRFSY